jgi:TPR repeat protein
MLNFDERIEYCKKAAELGYLPAQLEMIFCEFRGIGMDPNVEKARLLLSKLDQTDPSVQAMMNKLEKVSK